jgi:hypothetical protein
MNITKNTIESADYGEVLFSGENKTLYRVVTEGGFGMTHVNVSSVSVSKCRYAQYDNALRVDYLEKGKRKPVALVIKPGAYLAIYKLEDAPEKMDPFNSTPDGGKITKYSMFDTRWLVEWREHARHAIHACMFDGSRVPEPFGRYQVSTPNGSLDYFSVDGLLQAGHEVIGYQGKGKREELENHPKLKGFLGPCYGGRNADGTCTIYYEAHPQPA